MILQGQRIVQPACLSVAVGVIAAEFLGQKLAFAEELEHAAVGVLMVDGVPTATPMEHGSVGRPVALAHQRALRFIVKKRGQGRPWVGTINERMIERRHREITEAGHPGSAMRVMRILRALFYYAIDTYEDEEQQPYFKNDPVRRSTGSTPGTILSPAAISSKTTSSSAGSKR